MHRSSGNLYTVNLVERDREAGGRDSPAGLARRGRWPGLAVHPESGVLYGVTSEQSPNEPAFAGDHRPETGAADARRRPGHTSPPTSRSTRRATLYVWLPTTTQLGTVDLTTGARDAASGRPRPAGTPAGIAIDPNGMVYVTAKGASGTLDNVDTATGACRWARRSPGRPFSTQINSMSFSPSGLLLAHQFERRLAGQLAAGTINTRHRRGRHHRLASRRQRLRSPSRRAPGPTSRPPSSP